MFPWLSQARAQLFGSACRPKNKYLYGKSCLPATSYQITRFDIKYQTGHFRVIDHYMFDITCVPRSVPSPARRACCCRRRRCRRRCRGASLPRVEKCTRSRGCPCSRTERMAFPCIRVLSVIRTNTVPLAFAGTRGATGGGGHPHGSVQTVDHMDLVLLPFSRTPPGQEILAAGRSVRCPGRACAHGGDRAIPSVMQNEPVGLSHCASPPPDDTGGG
jgi:hypothetical protein